MLIRLNRSKRQLIVFVIIGIILVATTVVALKFLYINQLKDSYELKLTMANNTINDNKKLAFVAKEKISAGDKITKDKVDYKEVFTSVPEESLITDKDFGKLSTINISPQIPVTKDMVTESIMSKDLREEEFNSIFLSSNLKEGDFVDVRLIYPNGEDFIVLSKKAVKNLSLESGNCFLWLNEEEILTMSGAIVDAYLHEGCKLYTTKYIEPMVQEPSLVTYSPSEEVINLIHSDPNVVQRAAENLNSQIRNELESRLDNFYQNYNGEVTWDSPDKTPNNITYQTKDTPEKAQSDQTNNSEVNTGDSTESEDEAFYVD